MRILFVSSGNSEEGINQIVRNQGESIKSIEKDLYYFTIHQRGIPGYLKYTILLWKYLRQNKFHIVHAHYSFCGIVAFLAAGFRIPVVTSLMGGDLSESKWMFRITKFFAKYLWKSTIVKSEGMKKKLGVAKVEVIPNGVDFEVFKPINKKEAMHSVNFESTKKYILFVSYSFRNEIRKEKNYSLLESALKLIEDPTIEVKILFYEPYSKLNLYYNAADMLVLTSFREGSPNVIKEAMACNLPIVTTNVGDVEKIITGVEGCYLTSFHPEDVARRIKEALKLQGRTNGREKIGYLNSHRIAERIITVYKNNYRSSYGSNRYRKP